MKIYLYFILSFIKLIRVELLDTNFKLFENTGIADEKDLIEKYSNIDSFNCMIRCAQIDDCDAIITPKNMKTCKLFKSESSNYISSNETNMFKKFWNLDYKLNGQVVKVFESINKSSISVTALLLLKNDFLVSGFSDGTIGIWNSNNKKFIRQLNNHTAVIRSLAELQIGYIASGSPDKKINIWNPNNGTLIKTLFNSDPVYSLAVLPNGNLASGSVDFINVWSNIDYSLIRTITHYMLGTIWSLISLNNGYLVSGSTLQNLKFFDSDNGNFLCVLKSHNGTIFSLAVLNDGLIASGSGDSSIKIWNSNNCQLMYTLYGHTLAVRSLVLLKNGYLASGSFDNTIKIWDLNKKTCVNTLENYFDVSALAVLRNGFLASSRNDVINVWS